MVRTLSALLVGLICAIVIILVIEWLSHQYYSFTFPDSNNTELMKTFVNNLPFGAILWVLIAWIMGSFVGGFVASLIKYNIWISIGISLTILCFSVINMLSFPHPFWIWINAIFWIMPSGICGHFASKLCYRIIIKH